MEICLKVESLTKIYQISHKNAGKPTLRESLESRIRNAVSVALGRQQATMGRGKDEKIEQFKALDNVSFEVAMGDRLAIVGQNGSGKSTLLKILSRITAPTNGRVLTKGRISSLLEVGTGFHPELSGRENIFLNGSVLGMKRSDIVKKFDEIVAFSEIDKFLDTPVKYYSSGMYVRLAFSVAAHLDPEILILDEVLAVGDMRFQQKCLEKMRYSSNEGRTILYVSHNLQSVTQICPNAILLEKGRIKAAGPSSDVIQEYTGLAFVDGLETTPGNLAEYFPLEESGDRWARLLSARVCNEEGEISSTLFFHRKIFLEMEYEILLADGSYFVPNLHIYNLEGILLFVSIPPNGAVAHYENGRYKAVCEIPGHLLNDGIFRVMLALSSWKDSIIVHYAIANALTFKVVDDLSDVSYRNGYPHVIPGLFRPRFSWSIKKTK